MPVITRGRPTPAPDNDPEEGYVPIFVLLAALALALERVSKKKE